MFIIIFNAFKYLANNWMIWWYIMSARGDLCVFTQCNGCYELHGRQSCTNMIEVVNLRIPQNLMSFHIL